MLRTNDMNTTRQVRANGMDRSPGCAFWTGSAADIDPRIRRAVASLGLSCRETQLVELVCLGIDTLSVCEILQITESTVRTHFRRIFANLGLANRSQLVTCVLFRIVDELDQS